jgi:Tfp pilus assembly ATPase PilU
MAQVFPKGFNSLFRILLIGLPLSGSGTGVMLAAFYRSDYTTGARDTLEQPVMFSHKHHNAELGIDCR